MDMAQLKPTQATTNHSQPNVIIWSSVSEDQPRNTTLGFFLGRSLCQLHTIDLAEFDTPVWNYSFTPPKYSPEFLAKAHFALVELDIEVLGEWPLEEYVKRIQDRWK